MSFTSVLYIDASQGLSGDMFVAALLDLGVEIADLRERLKSLKISGFEIHSKSVQRGPFRAQHFSVAPENPSAEGPIHTHGGHHLHAHAEPAFHGQPHRHWHEIRALLHASRPGLGDSVVERALKVFECLARAEAHVHGIDIEDVHFHEVGAVDSIVDIVSVSLCLDMLGIEDLVSSPLPLSTGHITTAHGQISLPAPATLELLNGWPVRSGREGLEQVTPTGAAIVAALAKPGPMPSMQLAAIGVGGGSADPKGWPNVLRLMLGRQELLQPECDSYGSTPDQVDVLSAHMDDLTGEHLPGLLQALLDAGALDAFATPIIMKKGRSGLWVQALTAPEHTGPVSEALLAHGSSFGLRRTRVQREVLDRWHESVDTSFGPIRIKIGSRHGQTLHASPEFEDVRQAAQRSKVPIPRVHSAAVVAWNIRARDEA
jgi:uncharacterized protein (TIGR00299 family) protein